MNGRKVYGRRVKYYNDMCGGLCDMFVDRQNRLKIMNDKKESSLEILWCSSVLMKQIQHVKTYQISNVFHL